MPGEVLEVRKRESRDTEPNRFVKFALEQFRELCRKVEEEFGERSVFARRSGADADALGWNLGAALFPRTGADESLAAG